MIKALIISWHWFLIVLQIIFLTMRLTGYVSWPAWKYLSPGILLIYSFVLGVSYVYIELKEKQKKGKPK